MVAYCTRTVCGILFKKVTLGLAPPFPESSAPGADDALAVALDAVVLKAGLEVHATTMATTARYYLLPSRPSGITSRKTERVRHAAVDAMAFVDSLRDETACITDAVSGLRSKSCSSPRETHLAEHASIVVTRNLVPFLVAATC